MIDYLLLYLGSVVLVFMGLTIWTYMDREDLVRYSLASLFWILYIPFWVVVVLIVRVIRAKLVAATGFNYFKQDFYKKISNNYKIAIFKVLFINSNHLSVLWEEHEKEILEQEEDRKQIIENLKMKYEFEDDIGL